MKVMCIGGATRIVRNNPPKSKISFTDFVRDNDGNMVLKPKLTKRNNNGTSMYA